MNKKPISLTKWICVLVFISVIVFIAVMFNHYSKKTIPNSLDIDKITFEGNYIKIGNDTNLCLSSEDEVDARKYSSVVLEGHFDGNIDQGEEFIIYLYRISVSIYKNGELFYSSSDKTCETIMWDIVKVGSLSSDDDIIIKINAQDKDAYSGAYSEFLDNIYCGSAYDMSVVQVNDNLLQMLIAVILFLIGISMLVTEASLLLMHIYVPKEAVTSAALLVTGGIGIFIDYKYINFVYDNPYVIGVIDFVNLTFIFFFLVMHLETYIIQERFKWLAKAVLCATGLIIIISYGFQIFGDAGRADAMGRVFPVLFVILIIELILFILETKTGKIHRSIITIVATLLLTSFIILEMVVYAITNMFIMYFFIAGFLCFGVLQFVHIIKDSYIGMQRARAAEKLENELKQNKIAMMLSQIQPHFMNNAIASVQMLCKEDPDKAYEALGHFAKFLRGNMNSITSSDLVSYENELDYVKNYVYLQQLRYEDDLKVIYKTEFDNFFIPALSVQPLVENAIRYGVAKKPGVGTVIIHSWKETSGVYICVEDDGVGFDESQLLNDDSYTHRFHVGTTNVRNRLKAQCGGTLTVESVLGEGTKATIFLPDVLI
ncbi:MAG: histidine kinase [Eubacterium sp.]|nr:histidine kinase [Eubacterium sp.]